MQKNVSQYIISVKFKRHSKLKDSEPESEWVLMDVSANIRGIWLKFDPLFYTNDKKMGQIQPILF